CSRRNNSIHSQWILLAWELFSEQLLIEGQRAVWSALAAAPPTTPASALLALWAGNFWIAAASRSNNGPVWKGWHTFAHQNGIAGSKHCAWRWMCKIHC